MSGWTTSERVVRLRRHRPIDVLVEVAAGWQQHLSGRSAAVITYYGFLSVFPLLLVASTVLALVLRDNEDLQERILDTIVAQIPIIGAELVRTAGQLSGGPAEIVIGLLIALWASTKAFVGVHVSMDQVWEVPFEARDTAATKRGKAVVGIVVIGVGILATTAVTTIASLADLALVGRLLLLLGGTLISTAMLLAMYRSLCSIGHPPRALLPGALLAGVAFTLLQLLGVIIIDRYLARSTSAVGVFATVFALILWINLHAMGTMVGAELNAALVRLRDRQSDDEPGDDVTVG